MLQIAWPRTHTRRENGKQGPVVKKGMLIGGQSKSDRRSV